MAQDYIEAHLAAIADEYGLSSISFHWTTRHSSRFWTVYTHRGDDCAQGMSRNSLEEAVERSLEKLNG